MSLRTVTYRIDFNMAGVDRGKKKMQVTLQTMEQDAGKSQQAIQKLGQQIGEKLGVKVNVAVDELKTFNSQMRQGSKEASRNARAYDELIREYTHMSNRVGLSADKQEILNAQFRLGRNATAAQKAEVERLVSSYQRLRNTANQTQGSMRGLRGQMSNIGFQLQDIAVQAQMGTAGLVILGQQGSQLAAGFGPQGALVGAFIAIAAAVGGVLAPSLFDARNNMQKLEDAAESLDEILSVNTDGIVEFSDGLQEIAKRSKETAQSLLLIARAEQLQAQKVAVEAIAEAFDDLAMGIGASAREMDYLTDFSRAGNVDYFNSASIAMQNLRDALTDLDNNASVENIDKLEQAINGLRWNGDFATDTARNFAKEVFGLIERFRAAEKGVTDLTKPLEDLTALFTENEEKTKDFSDANSRLVENLRQQADILGFTSIQALEYKRGVDLMKLSQQGATAEQIESVNTYYDQIIAAEALNLQRKDEAEFIKELKAQYKLINAEAREKAKADREAKKVESELLALERQKLSVASRVSTDAQLNARRIQYEQEREIFRDNITMLRLLEEEYAQDRLAINGSFWERYLLNAQETLETFDEIAQNSLDRLVSSFGQSMASIVTQGQAPGEALENMFKSALGAMVQFFAEWAAQKVILWALDKTLSKTAAAGAATAKTGEATAMTAQAAINAYQSAAAIPAIGWLLAPGAAQAALAYNSPLIGAVASGMGVAVGAYDGGGRIMPGAAGIVAEFGDELVGGTMIYNGSQNSLSVTGRQETARQLGGRSLSIGSINVTSNGNTSPTLIGKAIVKALERSNKRLDTAIYDSTNRGSRNRGKRFNA